MTLGSNSRHFAMWMRWPSLLVPVLADLECAFAHPGFLSCRSSMRHTCSAAPLYYLVPECPADCPYIVEDPFFPCAASCVARSLRADSQLKK